MATRVARFLDKTLPPTPDQGQGPIQVAGRRPLHLPGLDGFRKARQMLLGVDQPPWDRWRSDASAEGGPGVS
jgi:hypothetical protein